MHVLSRRQFTRQTLGSLVTYSLLETAFRADAFAAPVEPVTREWLTDLNELCQDIRGQTLRHVEWQSKVEELLGHVDLPDLLRLIDFERLTHDVAYPEKGARSLRFQFPRVEGLPAELVFGKQIFALKKGRSVVPHGHDNMATAFLVLQGDLRGRHYDRLEDADDHIVIRPTLDSTFGPGGSSTVSDYKDNVHWFEALTEPAYIFNIHVLQVTPGSVQTGRVYLNPNVPPISGGLIRAPRIDHAAAIRLFG